LSPLAKEIFQYIQARSGKGGRNMEKRNLMVFPIQRMKQSAMLVLNVAWETWMLLWKAMVPMDLYAASVNEHFILLVCICLQMTSIAQIVTKNMWCPSVKQGPSLKTCYKVNRCQRHKPALHTQKVI